MKNIIKTMLISLISINTYAICPFPADTKPPNEGIIPWLGGGFDFDRERIKVISCLNGQKVMSGGGEVSLNATLLTSQEQVLNELERKVGGKIKIGFLVWVAVRLLLIKLLKKAFLKALL
ncbi:hypothetical protein [Candidatus Marithrix sp. Canyon 246]|uniref:hypothetical protein n=1 Tax=Candidatus Marithrix sp. Canyon 246 TaxID=1827136 RepID=UPI00114D0147|nr:hypothetical protein [Candidatus Marithrix sp. Canyon 246]